MEGGILALADGVGAIRISHHGESFVVFDQLVDQSFCSLVMAIVVAGAVNQQEISLEIVGEIDRRSLSESINVVTRQSHVAFLVNRVIVTLIAYRRD